MTKQYIIFTADNLAIDYPTKNDDEYVQREDMAILAFVEAKNEEQAIRKAGKIIKAQTPKLYTAKLNVYARELANEITHG